jgi:ribonuclease G
LGEVLSASQSILVQIAKEPISTKGPRLTAEVTLAGRYMVLVPFINKVSISSRLTDEVERKRLKELLQAIRPKNFGVIIRTNAEGRKSEDLETDLKNLLQRWDEMFAQSAQRGGPQTGTGRDRPHRCRAARCAQQGFHRDRGGR